MDPRKSGKTICLRQLSELPNTKYYNFKVTANCDFEVLHIVRNNTDTLLLLDEVTYMDNPELFIRSVAAYCDDLGDNFKTKIVFTGSQSYALQRWGSIAFGGQQLNVTLDFLSYSEWLDYKQIEKPSVNNYNQFLLEISDFYKFTSFRDYLQGCLDETIISNVKCLEYVFGNKCDLVDVDILLDILYMSIFVLHNHSNRVLYIDRHTAVTPLMESDVDQHIKDTFSSYYNQVCNCDNERLQQAFIFLRNCDLITITNISDNLDRNTDIEAAFLKYDYNLKRYLFGDFSFCIRYPMFYVCILKDLFGDNLDVSKNPILSSIIECHARGLLSNHRAVEYHEHPSREVNYVNTLKKLAISFKVTNDYIDIKQYHKLPRDYRFISLTEDISETKDGVEYIPYPEFLSKY